MLTNKHTVIVKCYAFCDYWQVHSKYLVKFCSLVSRD